MSDKLKRYVSCKIVNAMRATCKEASQKIGRPIPSNGDQDGYLIEYEDGYLSWCPKDTFERDYLLVLDEIEGSTSVPFVIALKILNQGGSITCDGWMCYLKRVDDKVYAYSMSDPLTKLGVYEFSMYDILICSTWKIYIEPLKVR